MHLKSLKFIKYLKKYYLVPEKKPEIQKKINTYLKIWKNNLIYLKKIQLIPENLKKNKLFEKIDNTPKNCRFLCSLSTATCWLMERSRSRATLFWLMIRVMPRLHQCGPATRSSVFGWMTRSLPEATQSLSQMGVEVVQLYLFRCFYYYT